jgi:nucleoside-diphosphate-sugar epimerase
MSDIKRIILLGHSGFIGSHLEKNLTAHCSYEIIGKSLPDIDLSNLKSADQLLELFDENTVLVLMAAVKRQFGDTLEAFDKNMAIVENVCHLIEKSPVKHIIFMSSAAVYGEETHNTNISESTPVNPTSFYGIAKYTAERILKKTCLAKGISLICLRPPLIYGPGDSGKTYGPSGFSASALEGSTITLWGDGTELREFLYIDDLCHLIRTLIDKNINGELNVVSGNSYSFSEIINILRTNFPELELDSKPRSKEKADNAFDAAKVKKNLPENYQFTSLEAGLAKLIKST